MSEFEFFKMAFLAIARVTAQEGYKSGISCSIGSSFLPIFGVSVTSGLTTTLSPAKSLPSSKWTPLNGKEGSIPITTSPVTKSDDKCDGEGY